MSFLPILPHPISLPFGCLFRSCCTANTIQFVHISACENVCYFNETAIQINFKLKRRSQFLCRLPCVCVLCELLSGCVKLIFMLSFHLTVASHKFPCHSRGKRDEKSIFCDKSNDIRIYNSLHIMTLCELSQVFRELI